MNHNTRALPGRRLRFAIILLGLALVFIVTGSVAKWSAVTLFTLLIPFDLADYVRSKKQFRATNTPENKLDAEVAFLNLINDFVVIILATKLQLA